MANKEKGAQAMTNEQTQILLEAIKMLAEKSNSKQEFIEALERLQIKKPQ